MPTIHSSTGARTRSSCDYCGSRHRGSCLGVGDEDTQGLSFLEFARSPVRLYDAGEMVYAQGDQGEHIFNLISGWIALHRDMADGRRQIARFLLPGALFGIEPPGQEFGHTATAVTKIIVCPIARVRFDDLRRRIPSLNERFIELLEQENHHAIETLTTLGQGSAKERIGALIGQLVRALCGESPINPGTVVRIPLTQRHIGEATGLTSIHVNRVLRQLREDNVIELHNGMLVVTNPRKLLAPTAPSADRAWPSARAAPYRSAVPQAHMPPMRLGRSEA